MTPLASVADFQIHLDRDLDESRADLALAGASGVVRLFCRWIISAEETTFVVDGSGSDLLSLPTLRLNAVDEVRVDGEPLAGSDYTWSRQGQIQCLVGRFPRRFRAVEVDCTHGHDPVPDEIRAVVLTLATRYYINPEGLRAKTVGSVSRTYVLETMRGELSDLEIALIGEHRLP